MKNWIARLVRNHSISAMLNCLILPVLLLVMLIFGELCVIVYRQTISNHIKKELQLLTDSSAAYLDSFLSEATRQSYFIYSTQSLQNMFQEIYENREKVTIQATMDYYSQVINPLFASLNNPSWFVNRIYLLDDNLYADLNYIRTTEQLPVGLSLEDILTSDFDFSWNVAKSIPVLPTNTQEDNLLCYTRILYSNDHTPLALLNTEIHIDKLKPILSKAVLEQTGGAYLWKLRDGTAVLQSENFFNNRWMARGEITCGDSILETSYSDDLVQQQSRKQHSILLVLSFFMVAVSFLLIYCAARLALRRIRKVTKKFALFDGGSLSSAMEGKDEAALLDQTLTALYEKYRSNVEEYYKLEATYHAMEYQMLMSKINPHFLYNTLSAIRWSVLWDNKNDAAEAVDHMVAFYRGILNRGRDVIPLFMEIQTLQEYMQLQSYTYSREINFVAEITPEAHALFILKFLLQPILENAVLYSGYDTACMIQLKASVQDDVLCIQVWNDGPAILPDMIEKLNGFNAIERKEIPENTVAQSDKDSYGVYNVIARIRLLYGDMYGLWYSVPPKGGTLAEFHLPVLAHPEQQPDFPIKSMKI